VWWPCRASRGAAPRGPAWQVRRSTKRAPPTGVLAAGWRVMTPLVVDASTNTSVVRISVAGVGSEAAGMRRSGQPVLCRKPAAVHERPANTPVRRTRAGVITGRAGTKTREKVWGEARPPWDQRSWEKEAGKPAEWSARCRGGGREGGRPWCRGHTASRRCKADKAGWHRDRCDVIALGVAACRWHLSSAS